ncbi:MAG TPA: HAMP domain-containing sensor histidine kinase [Kofleriaceae bacterium]
MDATETAIKHTLAEASREGERIGAIARLPLCVIIAASATWYWLTVEIDHLATRMAITYSALALMVGLSLAVLFGLTRTWRIEVLSHVSVAIDSVAVFAVLLPTSLWPSPGYQNAPYLLDTSALLVVSFASGLRYRPSAAALAGGASGAALIGLAITDYVVGRTPAVELAGNYSIYVVLLAAVVALSLVMATRTRTVVERAARAAVAAEQAGHGLRTLLRDHHDLRTVITSAQLNADLLARKLAPQVTADGVGETVAHLREDLSELRTHVDDVKRRATENLFGLEVPSPAAVERAVAEVLAALSPRFPDVAIAAEVTASSVLVAGGAPNLRRIVANLVVNACEGDGANAPRRVDVHARDMATGTITIEVIDDGPGLPPHVLAAPPGQAHSTKRTGFGIGLGLVDGLVRASGGTLTFLEGEPGARVVVELPAAGPTKASPPG